MNASISPVIRVLPVAASKPLAYNGGNSIFESHFESDSVFVFSSLVAVEERVNKRPTTVAYYEFIVQ